MARLGTLRTVAGLTGVVLLAPLAGCGDDSPKGSDGPTPSSGSTLRSAPTSPSGASSATAATSSPGVGAATGDPLTVPGVTLRLARGWKVASQGSISQSGFDPQASTGVVYVASTEAFPSDSLDSLARTAEKADENIGRGADRQPDRTVGGVEGYVLSGAGKTFKAYYEFGVITGGQVVQISFEWRTAPPDASSIIESVLASVQWQ